MPYNAFSPASDPKMYASSNRNNEQFLKEMMIQKKQEQLLFQQELDDIYEQPLSNGFTDRVDQVYCTFEMDRVLQQVNIKRSHHDALPLIVDT